MIIPNPSQYAWKQWVETFIGFNDNLKNQLWVVSEENWKQFGNRLALILPGAPRPSFFKDWKSWARALQMSVGS